MICILNNVNHPLSTVKVWKKICVVIRLFLGLSTTISVVYIAGELEGVNLSHAFDLLSDWVFEYCDCMLWAWFTIENSQLLCSKPWLTNDDWKNNFKNWFGLCCANQNWFELIETRAFVALKNATLVFGIPVNAFSYEASRFIELCDCELQKGHGLMVVDTRLGFIVDLSIAMGNIALLLNGKWAQREVQGVYMEKGIRKDIRTTRLMTTLQYSVIGWTLKLEIQSGTFNIYDLEEGEAVLVDAGTVFIYWFVVMSDFVFQFQQASKGGFSDTSTLTNFVHHACCLFLILALVDEINLDVGTKLQVLLTEVALEITERCVVVQGMPLVMASSTSIQQQQEVIKWLLELWYQQWTQLEMASRVVFLNDEHDYLFVITFECQNCYVVAVYHRKMIDRGRVHIPLVSFRMGLAAIKGLEQPNEITRPVMIAYPIDVVAHYEEIGSTSHFGDLLKFGMALILVLAHYFPTPALPNLKWEDSMAIFHRKMIDRGCIHDHLVVIKWKTLPL